MASKPSGAVASMLEKEGMKNTIFLDGFTPAPPDVSHEILTSPLHQRRRLRRHFTEKRRSNVVTPGVLKN
jgi:hypothetical protein